MSFKKVVFLVFASFLVSLASYFAFNWLVFRRLVGNAALAVNSPSESLSVTLDGEVLGKTPYYTDAVKPGEPSLVLSSSKSSYKTKIKLTAGALTVVNYSLGPAEDFSEGETIWLEKSKDPGSLLVISDPDEAEVALDDKLLGQTPFTSKNVSSGDHTLKISQEGYRSRLIKVQSQPGYKLNLKVRLFLLPVSAGLGKLEYLEELRFKIYDFSANNAALYADTSAWAKGIVFYTGSLEKEASPSVTPYDFFVDYKGQIFDKEGIKESSPAVSRQEEVRVGYLGRKADAGLTEDARLALKSLSEKVLPRQDQVQILPTGTGWLRVRKEPSVSSPETARVNEGDKLTLLGEEGTFYKIKLPNGNEGYISKNFSRKL